MRLNLNLLGVLVIASLAANELPQSFGASEKKVVAQPIGQTVNREYFGKVEFLKGDSAIIHIDVRQDFPLYPHGMVWTDRATGQDLANMFLLDRRIRLRWKVKQFKGGPHDGIPHTVGDLQSWQP